MFKIVNSKLILDPFQKQWMKIYRSNWEFKSSWNKERSERHGFSTDSIISEETINNFIPQVYDNNELTEILMKMDIDGDEYQWNRIDRSPSVKQKLFNKLLNFENLFRTNRNG